MCRSAEDRFVSLRAKQRIHASVEHRDGRDLAELAVGAKQQLERAAHEADSVADDGQAAGELVVERRPVEGRIVHILDPAALVARGEEVIESATN